MKLTYIFFFLISLQGYSQSALDLIPTGDTNSRQYIVLVDNKNIIDTLAEVPKSYKLIDYQIYTQDKSISFISSSGDFSAYSKFRLDENDGIWKLILEYPLDKQPTRHPNSAKKDHQPITFKFKDMDTVIRIQNEDERIVDYKNQYKECMQKMGL